MMISWEFFGGEAAERGLTGLREPGRHAAGSGVGGNDHRNGERACQWEAGGAKLDEQITGRTPVAADGSDLKGWNNRRRSSQSSRLC